MALKALVAHRDALGAGIVADIVLRPPVEVDIDDAAIGFMRLGQLGDMTRVVGALAYPIPSGGAKVVTHGRYVIFQMARWR